MPKILINAILWRPVGGARILVPVARRRLLDVDKTEPDATENMAYLVSLTDYVAGGPSFVHSDR
jgi:hypothetical protein